MKTLKPLKTRPPSGLYTKVLPEFKYGDDWMEIPIAGDRLRIKIDAFSENEYCVSIVRRKGNGWEYSASAAIYLPDELEKMKLERKKK